MRRDKTSAQIFLVLSAVHIALALAAPAGVRQRHLDVTEDVTVAWEKRSNPGSTQDPELMPKVVSGSGELVNLPEPVLDPSHHSWEPTDFGSDRYYPALDHLDASEWSSGAWGSTSTYHDLTPESTAQSTHDGSPAPVSAAQTTHGDSAPVSTTQSMQDDPAPESAAQSTHGDPAPESVAQLTHDKLVSGTPQLHDNPTPESGTLPLHDHPPPDSGAPQLHDNPQPESGAPPSHNHPTPESGILPLHDNPPPESGAPQLHDNPPPESGAPQLHDNLPPESGIPPLHESPPPELGAPLHQEAIFGHPEWTPVTEIVPASPSNQFSSVGSHDVENAASEAAPKAEKFFSEEMMQKIKDYSVLGTVAGISTGIITAAQKEIMGTVAPGAYVSALFPSFLADIQPGCKYSDL